MSENEGEFKKRSLAKDDVESLVMRYWQDTFVNMKDVDEAANEFAKAFQTNRFDEEMIEKLLATGDIAHENYVKAFKIYKKWFGGRSMDVRGDTAGCLTHEYSEK